MNYLDKLIDKSQFIIDPTWAMLIPYIKYVLVKNKEVWMKLIKHWRMAATGLLETPPKY